MIDAIPSVGVTPTAPTDTRSVRDSTEQFEALLIAQMLKSARDETSGRDSESIRDMAEQEMASVMAKSGGLGLGKLIAAGITSP